MVAVNWDTYVPFLFEAEVEHHEQYNNNSSAKQPISKHCTTWHEEQEWISSHKGLLIIVRSNIYTPTWR